MKTNTKQLHFYTKLACLVILVWLQSSNLAYAQWTNIGSIGFSAANVDFVSTKFHPTSSEPYIAYRDGGNGYKTTVMRYATGAWANVGTAGFSAGIALYQSLAFHPITFEPYVAYQDAANSNKTTVMRYNGTTWVVVGAVGFSAGTALYQSLAFHPTTGEPYVAYQDGANSNKTTIMRYNGTTWVVVGVVGFSAGTAYYQSLDFHPTTYEPYIAYNDATVGNKTTVMRYNGTTWVNVGTAGFSAGGASYQSLAFHPTAGEPYVAYQDAANSNKITVMRYNGTTWVNVGTAGFSAGGASYQSLAFRPNINEPYVVYCDVANGSKTTVMRYNGTAWVNVGAAGFSAGGASYQSLAFHLVTGELYVAYQDWANNYEATMMYYPNPEINLQGNNTNIPDGDTSPTSTDYTDFEVVGTAGKALTYTIQNIGSLNLTISGITSDNADFVISGMTFPATIVGGGQATFTITFTPTGANGTKTANISITNDDIDENPYDFVVQGYKVNQTPSTVRGNMMTFDGINDAVSTTTVLSSATTNVTIEGWVKVNSYPAADAGLFYNGATGLNGYGLYISNTGLLRILFGGITFVNTTYTLPLNTWQHVALVHNGTTWNVYANGVLQLSNSTPSAVPAGKFVIGAGYTSGINLNFLHGSLDEVRFWNIARTQAQIRESMHLTLSGAESNLLAYYQFNETSGNAIDAIAGKNGTLNGGATQVSSTLSVAKGTSNRQTISTGAGNYNFAGTNCSLNFSSVGTAGEIVVNRLEGAPYGTALAGTTSVYSRYYWVINNYGTTSFSALPTFILGANTINSADVALPTNLKLNKRDTNIGTVWATINGTSANATTGSVTFGAITSFSEFGVTSDGSSALPITLLGLKGRRVEGLQGESTEEVTLEWATASEINNKGFDVEMSKNGLAYQTIAFIEGKGNSTTVSSYQLALNNPNDGYYRLRQVDFDGKFSYSPIVFVEGLAGKVVVYPNPNNGTFTVVCGTQTTAGKLDSPARLLNVVGKEVWRGAQNEVKTDLPAGVYFLHTTVAGKTTVTKLTVER